MEREACVCDHGFERSDLCAEMIIIIIIIIMADLLCHRSFFSCKVVPSPSETWFRGMSVGGSFRRE